MASLFDVVPEPSVEPFDPFPRSEPPAGPLPRFEGVGTPGTDREGNALEKIALAIVDGTGRRVVGRYWTVRISRLYCRSVGFTDERAEHRPDGTTAYVWTRPDEEPEEEEEEEEYRCRYCGRVTDLSCVCGDCE